MLRYTYIACPFDPLFGIVTLGTGWYYRSDSKQEQEICLSSGTYRSDRKVMKPDVMKLHISGLKVLEGCFNIGISGG
jgi:hypothetical protein